MVGPGPIASGPRVALWTPGPEAEAEFVAAVDASRPLHRPWVAPPDNADRYQAYLRRLARRDQVGFLLRARPDGDGADGAGPTGSGPLVGVVNVNNIVLRAFRSGYLGYYAFAPHAGRGLLREGVALVVAHAFETMGLHRLEANIQPANVASSALVRALGFRLEGYSPAYLFIDGAWRDHERWAIVAGDGRLRARPGRTPP